MNHNRDVWVLLLLGLILSHLVVHGVNVFESHGPLVLRPIFAFRRTSMALVTCTRLACCSEFHIELGLWVDLKRKELSATLRFTSWVS